VICCIADLQSAGRGQTGRPGGARHPAECNSAIQQITNLRYVAGQRWQKVCAENQNVHGSNADKHGWLSLQGAALGTPFAKLQMQAGTPPGF